MKIIYKNNILTSNGTIPAEGTVSPSVIIFRNQGTSVANVLGNVKVYPGDELVLKNDPGIVIENTFIITFDADRADLTNNMAVIRGYYKE